MPRTILVAVAAVLLAACGGGAAPVSEETSVVGARGIVRFTAAPDEALVEGTNAFQVELAEVEGDAPIAGASLGAHVTMRSMGHEAPDPPLVSELTDGSYRLDEVIFTMPGVWELHLEAQTEVLYDEVGFLFEVP